MSKHLSVLVVLSAFSLGLPEVSAENIDADRAAGAVEPMPNASVSTSLEGAIGPKLDEVSAIEAYAAEALAEFDQTFDPTVALQDSDAYAKLWAARITRASKLARLADQVAVASEADPAKAGEVLVNALKKRQQSGETGTAIRVAESLGEHGLLGSDVPNAPPISAKKSRFGGLPERFKKAIADMAFGPAALKKIKALRTAKLKGGDTIVSTLNGLATELKAQWFDAEDTAAAKIYGSVAAAKKPIPAAGNGRRPAAARYAPSVSPNGNISGMEFPAGMWALTFDDGPGVQTAAVLDELKKRKLKATFFCLTKNMPEFGLIVPARTKPEGHELANHSATHAQLTKVSSAQLDREILDSTTVLESIYGYRPRFFRTPYGSGRNELGIRQRIAQAGMIHVFWNVDTLDWQDRNPDSIFRRTMKQIRARGRGVILFHDIHDQTVVASARVMDQLIADRAQIVTVREAVDALNGERR